MYNSEASWFRFYLVMKSLFKCVMHDCDSYHSQLPRNRFKANLPKHGRGEGLEQRDFLSIIQKLKKTDPDPILTRDKEEIALKTG